MLLPAPAPLPSFVCFGTWHIYHIQREALFFSYFSDKKSSVVVPSCSLRSFVPKCFQYSVFRPLAVSHALRATETAMPGKPGGGHSGSVAPISWSGLTLKGSHYTVHIF